VFASKLNLGRTTLSANESSSEEKRGRPALGEIISHEEKGHARFLEDEKKKDDTPKRFELKAEFPFSSELKRMTTIYVDNESKGRAMIFIKGAVSTLSSSYHLEF